MKLKHLIPIAVAVSNFLFIFTLGLLAIFTGETQNEVSTPFTDAIVVFIIALLMAILFSALTVGIIEIMQLDDKE